MSDIFAPLAAGTPRPDGTAAGGAGAGETAIRVVDPSPDLSRLAGGENLRGTVVGKDDHGHLLVRTRLGVLQLAAHRSLPAGTEVVLQVRSVGPQVLINLLPLEAAGGSANPAPAQAPPGTTPGTPAAPQAPVPPHDLIQRGQAIRAVLHAAPPVPLLGGLPTARPGAELLVQVLSLAVQPSPGTNPAGGNTAAHAATVSGTPLPAGAARPAAASPSPGAGSVPAPGGQGPQASPAPSSQPPAAGPAGAAPPATGAQTSGAAASTPGLRLAPQIPVAKTGHSLATALQSVSTEAAVRAAGGATGQPAGPAATSIGPPTGTGPATAAQSLRLTGLVTGSTSNGQPILHTALGTLTLDAKTTLPPGSSLALQVTAPPAAQGPAALALPAAWAGLDTLEETLFQGLPAQQTEAVARALPQVGPRLASGVLFFLSALNQGNPLAWFAPAAAAGAGRESAGEVFERLGREFLALNRSIETVAGEWRFVNLPVWSDQGLRELRCFFRHQEHGGASGGGDGDKETRFVLELDLERHGELQLDGLVRARRFDLMLRSRRPLPALVRGDLIALFEEANAIAGYSGQLVFQASKDWLQLLSARSDTARQEGVTI